MIIKKYCLQCGEPLSDYAPVNKLYCNDVCKQSAYHDCPIEPEPVTQVDESAVNKEEGSSSTFFWLSAIGIGLGIWEWSLANKVGGKAIASRPNSLPLTPKSAKR